MLFHFTILKTTLSFIPSYFTILSHPKLLFLLKYYFLIFLYDFFLTETFVFLGFPTVFFFFSSLSPSTFSTSSTHKATHRPIGTKTQKNPSHHCPLPTAHKNPTETKTHTKKKKPASQQKEEKKNNPSETHRKPRITSHFSHNPTTTKPHTHKHKPSTEPHTQTIKPGRRSTNPPPKPLIKPSTHQRPPHPPPKPPISKPKPPINKPTPPI